MPMPTAATIITVPPSVGDGWKRRRTASAPIAPIATSRNSELASAARIGRLLQTISEPRRSRAPGHHRSRPGNHEPEHIRQIVAGVGQQRHRVGKEAVDCLDRKKAEVERDSDGERSAEIARRMRMAVRVHVGVAVRMVGHAHDLADASAEIQMRFVERPSDFTERPPCDNVLSVVLPEQEILAGAQ